MEGRGGRAWGRKGREGGEGGREGGMEREREGGNEREGGREGGREKKREEKIFLFKVEQNGKYNTSEFAITSTSHTICTT